MERISAVLGLPELATAVGGLGTGISSSARLRFKDPGGERRPILGQHLKLMDKLPLMLTQLSVGERQRVRAGGGVAAGMAKR